MELCYGANPRTLFPTDWVAGGGGIQLCFKAVPRVMCAARPLLSLFLSLSVSPSLVHALFCLCGCPRPLAGVVSQSGGACVTGHVRGACAGVHVPWLGWCPSPGVRASLAASFLPFSFFLFVGCVCWCPRPLAGVVSQSRGACVTGHVLPCCFRLSLLCVSLSLSISLSFFLSPPFFVSLCLCLPPCVCMHRNIARICLKDAF